MVLWLVVLTGLLTLTSPAAAVAAPGTVPPPPLVPVSAPGDAERPPTLDGGGSADTARFGSLRRSTVRPLLPYTPAATVPVPAPAYSTHRVAAPHTARTPGAALLIELEIFRT